MADTVTPLPRIDRFAVSSSMDHDSRRRADAMAADLGWPRRRSPAVTEPSDAVIEVTPEGFQLHVAAGAGEKFKPFRIRLDLLDTGSPAGQSLQQPLAKALGLRKGQPARPRVFDATAGWAEDSMLIAGLGCEVLACERHPVIRLMVDDALAWARKTRNSPAHRVALHEGDALAWLTDWPTEQPRPDVVYLDPMYASPRKTRERKPLRLLRALADATDDGSTLLAPARALARRVVVKRPRHAAPLASEPPVTSHTGKSTRYDIYPGT